MIKYAFDKDFKEGYYNPTNSDTDNRCAYNDLVDSYARGSLITEKQHMNWGIPEPLLRNRPTYAVKCLDGSYLESNGRIKWVIARTAIKHRDAFISHFPEQSGAVVVSIH